MPSFRIPSIRQELLPAANGKKATDELALKRLANEQQARLDHVKRLREIGSPLATAAAKAAGLENPNKTSSAVVFEEPDESQELHAIKADLEAAEANGDATVYKIPTEKTTEVSTETDETIDVEDPEHKLVA